MAIALILASALTLGLYDVCKKHAVADNGILPGLWCATALGTVAVLIGQAAAGTLAPAAAGALAAAGPLLCKALLVSASWICAWHAMRALPITIASPIRGSQPVWTVAGALLLFQEAPSALQAGGIALALAGYLAFSFAGRKEGIRFFADRGVALIFLATLLGAASGLYDKFLLQPRGLSPETVQLGFQIGLVGVIGLAWVATAGAGRRRTPFVWRWSVAATGLLLVCSDWFYFTALAQPGAQLCLLSPVRRSSAILAFLIGGAVFRDENRLAKGFALVLVAAGVVLICL